MSMVVLISTTIAVCSFIFSAINFVLGKYVANKIFTNELVHINADIDEIKAEDKEYKKILLNEIVTIGKRLSRIEKEITKREAICNERHKK